jgi:imidazole glycerol phosphate synthase subunit HisF
MNTFKPWRLSYLAIVVAAVTFPMMASAAAVPCEDALKEMRATKASANLAPDVKSKVDALETKAVERCNADDDKRADGFLQDAMKQMGK